MKKVTFEDLYSFHFLSDIAVSPDEQHLVFSQHQADEKKNGYNSCLWLMDTATGAHHQITFGGGERGAKWLDAQNIMFSANRSEEKGSKYYKLNVLEGGEAQPLLTIPERVASLELLDGDKYVGVMIKHSEGKEEEKPEASLDGRDLLVFDETYFWFNGQGIRNKLRNSLFVFDAKKNKLKQITSQYFNTAAYAVSPDKQKIAFTGAAYENKVVNKNGLYVYDVKTGRTKTIVKQGENVVGAIAWVDDEQIFAAVNDFAWSGRNSRFQIFSPTMQSR